MISQLFAVVERVVMDVKVSQWIQMFRREVELLIELSRLCATDCGVGDFRNCM